MFNIGLPELLIIVAIALIVFGPNKLPELARAFGKAMREFKKAKEEVKESFEAETKELEEFKHNLADENLLADLAEHISPQEEHAMEEASPSSSTAHVEKGPSEADAAQKIEEHTEEIKKEEIKGEGIPSHG